MAFELMGAPNTFQWAMNSTLSPLLRKCVIIFFDDILVYSSSFSEHISHLQQVLLLFQADSWCLKRSKCRFAQHEISYLGHIISSKGIHTDPAKVEDSRSYAEAVASWPEPTSLKELRSFLSLAGFYRKFVRHFAIITKPLTNLLKKGSLFVWTDVHSWALSTLKQAFISAPVLGIPNLTKPFAIETDACHTGVGAVLL